MEVKPGFKQTEVGVIPIAWDVKSAHQIGKPVRGGSPRPAGDPRYFNGSYIPWLTVAALTNIPTSQLVVSETASYLTEEGSLHSRTLAKGTLIIANSGATLGVAKILGIKCCANDGIAALLNFSKDVSPRYIAHFINTKTNYLRDIVATGNGQPNLNTELIGNFKIPLPPTKAEQEAISDILSDTDDLIESLEQLIAKKRDVKQGAMQELLTGKKRLPGFNNEWQAKPLGDCGEVIMGQSPPGSSYNRNGLGSPLINGPTEFTDQHPIKIQWTTQPARFCKAGDLLICVRGSSTGRTNYADDMYAIGRGVAAIRAKDHNDTEYLSYQVISAVSDILAAATGSTFPSVDGASFRKIVVPLPSPAEQTAIATILSDMDAELDGIETKLAKARQVKQGMTQELLTGRIRLV